MTAPVSPVSADIATVLARIASIQQRMSPPPVPASNVAGPDSAASNGAASNSANGATATSMSSSASGAGSATSATRGTFATALAQFTGASTGQPGSGVTGSQVVTAAEKYLGVPYVFGGTTTSGLDCSGLVQKAYGDLGVSLPRLSEDQAEVGAAVPSLAKAQPGDILAFGDPAYHVAIYLGGNQMIAAPEPGENVKIQSVYQTPTTIRRVLGGDTTAANAALTGPLNAATANTGISPAVQQYSALFSQNESQYNLPSGLLAAVAQTESGGNTSAVSPAGAEGLMQLMPSTAAGLNVNPWDASQSIQGAAKLLSSYLSKYQSVPLALAAYNAGPGAIAQFGGVPPYAETQNYVTKIASLMSGASA